MSERRTGELFVAGSGDAPGVPTVDIEECARQPIHIPGSIQPHGVLLCLVGPEHTLVQASVNVASLCGIDVNYLLGRPASSLLDGRAVDGILRATGHMRPVPVEVCGVRFAAIAHRSDGLLVLDLEPREADGDSETCADLASDVFAIVERLRTADTMVDLVQATAGEIARLTGYDRAMVYRFHEDGHGEVIADAHQPDMESYLHLHYPASDVPAQARELYLINRTRCIVDIDAEPAAVAPVNNPLTGRPLDLSFSTLRSVAPTHLEYLRNMGVRASMSISLIKEGELWGLIACHHRRPRHVAFRRRMACDHLGQVLSWQLLTREHWDRAESRFSAHRRCSHLIESMAAEQGAFGDLAKVARAATELVSAGGVAICHDGRWTHVGQTPDDDGLDEICAWLDAHRGDPVYATHCLAVEQPGFERLKDVASGLLAISPSSVYPCFKVLWFRPEVVRTILWSGDPSKPVEVLDDGMRIGPRRSFAAWRELVRLHSLPWQLWEIEVARDLHRTMVDVVLRRAAEIERLNRELRSAVRMRDDFISMASHELRTPIFTLSLQIESLHRSAARRPGAFTAAGAARQLEVAKRQVNRVEQLVSGLLDFSRISAGRLTLDLEPVRLSTLIADVMSRFADDLQAAGCSATVRVDEAIVGRWDLMRLDQVLTNLLSNAVKYGAGKPIEIEASRRDGSARIAITDHGIGIAREAQARIFDRFERAVSSSHYGGLGLGLWIVRHIVERLGGTVDVASEPGRGATFTVELPLAGPEPTGSDLEAAGRADDA